MKLLTATCMKKIGSRHKGGIGGRIESLVREKTGSLLLESVISIALFTIVGTAVMSGLSTTQISGAQTERQSIAELVARNQMASIFESAYLNIGTDYPAVTAPQGYTVTATTAVVDELVPDPDVQKVIVTVSYGNETVFVLETIKAKQL